ncbi:uncharacterized protein SCHCODRAFT_02641375 [Schizophyllum commune H4-8]|uniref:uncharacterized protein n=1 Tax=Schizophyllum commune (strain H4-8 / FGSC 9210) TaxID=578458 RepID=UPI00215EB016|nr:uncharacterized protein SCHCODRAFT_02641375 [Schizophyllum commune H4-8]KAI5886275.1 hypothetical protein SCHCODRAFT_02641375 [Schizophyllum commune H4-8]
MALGRACKNAAHDESTSTATWFRGVQNAATTTDAPGIAIHNASALKGVDVATADQYRVAAIRMANLARVVRAL